MLGDEMSVHPLNSHASWIAEARLVYVLLNRASISALLQESKKFGADHSSFSALRMWRPQDSQSTKLELPALVLSAHAAFQKIPGECCFTETFQLES